MKVSEIVELLDAKILTEDANGGRDICFACGSDLMSDVLRFYHGKGVLITGLTNIHAVRTAEILGIGVIVYVCEKMPSEEVSLEARQQRITLIQTGFSMFETCGLLYANGIKCDTLAEEALQKD